MRLGRPQSAALMQLRMGGHGGGCRRPALTAVRQKSQGKMHGEAGVCDWHGRQQVGSRARA